MNAFINIQKIYFNFKDNLFLILLIFLILLLILKNLISIK